MRTTSDDVDDKGETYVVRAGNTNADFVALVNTVDVHLLEDSVSRSRSDKESSEGSSESRLHDD